MIKMVVSDMDGTLLTTNKQLPPDATMVVEALIERSIQVVIASGRNYTSIDQYFKPYSKKLTYISENGALVHHKGQKIYSQPLATDSLMWMIDRIEAIPNTLLLLCAEKNVYCRPLAEDETAERQIVETYYKECLTTLTDYHKCPEAVYELTIYCPERSEAICQQLQDVTSAEAERQSLANEWLVVASDSCWVDLMSSDVSKGKALAYLLSQTGVTSTECMAFGDYLNDEEMLQLVEESYAVAEAHPAIKAVAKYQIGSNDDYAVTKTLKQQFDLVDQSKG